MPFYIYFLFSYYLFLTILAIVAPLNYSFFQFLPGLTIMWISFVLFNRGARYAIGKNRNEILRFQQVESFERRNNGKINKIFVIFVLFFVVFIPLYINFYTGSLLSSVLTGIGSGTGQESNYYLYQQHMEENSLDQLTLSKLPYIFGYGFSKLLAYFFLFRYVGFVRNPPKWILLLLLVIFLMFSFVGLARGTSFENFEIAILFVFSILLRNKIFKNKDKFTRKQIFSISFFVLVLGAFFIFNKSLRYSEGMAAIPEGPSSTLQYDETHWSVYFLPSISKIALDFAGYFTFPLYFVSEVFWKIWMGSFLGLISMLFPFSAKFFFPNYVNYRSHIIALGVDTGACWDPDCTTFIYLLGIPLFCVLVYNLGKFTAKAYCKTYYKKDVANSLLLYLIFYEMIAMPQGNFLVISSSNQILLLSVVLIIYFNLFRKYRST